jgi:mRNA interferase MazF
MDKFISQKSIYECDFEGSKGSEQKGNRVGLVITNNVSNTFSPIVWIVPITSRSKKDLPTHHVLYQTKYPFLKYEENTVLVEQLTTRDECRIGKYVGKISDDDFNIIIRQVINNLRQY